ncbi:MAG: DegT/DnrJ/EryC1/StrS aminotransferase [Eubacteriales bacterium]|nr:DegT/DnrJ/EryC1/StrS aminotransferase [Eubacteriales bacterium]
MMKIGGSFPYIPLPQEPNHFLEKLTPPTGDLRYLMSGRCGIYYALEDLKLRDSKRVAYVPVYTCETVLAPFHKAGYELIFYDVTKEMVPVFDPAVLERISVISICGYYGFSKYDREFVAECSRRGICVIEDTTHSIFSADGIDPHCDYVVGSFRKWLGVASGGFALRREGKFEVPLLPPDEQHLKWRRECIDLKEQGAPEADDLFWKAEMQLRQIFDCYQADPESIAILDFYPVRQLQCRRRANYQYLLEHLRPTEAWEIVFPELPDGVVPSHMTVYAKEREAFRKVVTGAGISCTSYWPVGPLVSLEGRPEAAYIYEHVCSVPCDQRYGEEEMQRICEVLNGI